MLSDNFALKSQLLGQKLRGKDNFPRLFFVVRV